MTATADTPTTASWIAPGQHGFLHSEQLYFRAPEPADAGYPAAWNTTPYPLTRAQAEKALARMAKGKDFHIIACRKANDQPIGSAQLTVTDSRTATLRVHVDPQLGADGDVLLTDMLRTLIPYLASEHNVMIIWLYIDGPSPAVQATLAELGLRPTVRLREAVWRDGQRVDRFIFERYHPFWLQTLGDPGAVGIDAPPPATVRTVRRVSLAPPVAGPLPAGALMASERLALRLSDKNDFPEISRLIRHETETSWNRGRMLIGSMQIEHWLGEGMPDDGPPTEIMFAVIDRATGALIGEVGLADIDYFNGFAETASAMYLPAYRGQGYGTEAKNLLLEYAFDHLGLHMVVSYIWSFNQRSQAAIQKQGYRRAGGMQWRVQRADGFAANTVWDLLASEWRDRVGPRVTSPAPD